MSYKKQVRTVQTMPSSEELETAGIRELTGEELFKINGGRHVIDDPSTDNVSDTIANGGHSPGGSGSTSSGGSSSDSSGSSSSGSSSGSISDSSSSSGSSSSHDSSGSSSSDSSDNDYSSSNNSNSGYSGGSSGGGNNYTFPEENQASPSADTISQPVDQPHNGQENTGGTASVPQKPMPETIGEHKPKKRLTERVNEKFFQKFAKTQEYLVGTKYVYGAENPLNPKEGGVDCSGAIYYGLRTMGYILPRSNADSFLKKYTKEVERTQIMPGDLRGLKTKEGRFYHVQTLMQSYRINPSGDETNTQNNPGIVEKFDSPLPSTGVIRRLDQDKLNKYYDPGKDIISGKLSVGLLDRAYSELLQYSN